MMNILKTITTPEEHETSYVRASTLYRRYLAKWPSFRAANSHEMAGMQCVGFKGVDYSIVVSFDPDDATQNGVFWSAIKNQEEIAFIPLTQVPLGPRATLISLSAHFGINPDLLFAEALDLYGYWEAFPEEELIVPRFTKAKAYRYLAET
jgi:hypothetical protein